MSGLGEGVPADFNAARDEAFASIERTIPRLGIERPSIGEAGGLIYVRCGDNDWVDSFWNGQLWLAWSETQRQVFFDAARAQRAYFADRLARPESHTHDLGFLYSLSTVADYKLTGDDEARALGIAAAESLIRRYNPAGRFIQAWNPPPDASAADQRRFQGKIIVDCMMNLALLYWAAGETGRADFADIATAHADTNTRFIIRPDGSTYHTYDFDPDTGAPLGGFTAQGFADESCWSRGQAWAIHGYAQTYRYTGAERFRTVARRLADHAIPLLPADGVPPWDYRLTPDAPQYRDSSAAAIMAAGLFLLADTLGDGPDDGAAAEGYRATARRILGGLIAGYTTAGHPEAEGLLIHGASHVTRGRADTMLPYGDYFYVESLLRASGRDQFFW